MPPACHVWSLLERQEKGTQKKQKIGAMLATSSCGDPFHSSDGKQKQKQFMETTDHVELTAPDRFSVIPARRTKAHSCPEKLHNKTDMRFGSINRVQHASASTLCKSFHRVFNLPIRKAFTCLSCGMTLIYVWRVGKRLTNTRDKLLYQMPTFHDFKTHVVALLAVIVAHRE